MSFPCTQCGLCCQNIDKLELLRDFHPGDGVCIHYQPGVGCMIYEQRPLACRVDEGYQVFAGDLLSREEYYRGNAQVCNQLQEAAGFPRDWRVKL